jgi:hypothetical protein
MKKLKLTKGKYALIDDKDFNWLNQWKWSYLDSRMGYAVRCVYARNSNYKYKLLYLHRFIMNPPKGKQVDHINRNTMDCRRYNLRIVEPWQNSVNRKAVNTTGYRGVYCDKRKNKKWRADIIIHNKGKKFLGCFYTAEEAALAYNKAAKRFHGEYAVLN